MLHGKAANGDTERAADRSHLDLLDRAAALETAAVREDLRAVHTELCALRNELVAHLHGELSEVEVLGPASRRVVEGGQAELLRTVDDLLAHAADDDVERAEDEADTCNCVTRSIQLTRAIVRQAKLENSVFETHHRHPRRRPT